jgi:hypothetical protein
MRTVVTAILIRGLWARDTDCIIDVRIADVDAKSNRSEDPAKVSAAHEREKKKKHLGACLEQATSALIGTPAQACRILSRLVGLTSVVT